MRRAFFKNIFGRVAVLVQGLKPAHFYLRLAARLKSCPVTKHVIEPRCKSLRYAVLVAGLAVFLPVAAFCQAAGRQPGELAWAIHYDPKTFDPAKVDDQTSEFVRYLTGGVLLRINRQTQELDPQLAESYRISPQGTSITFKLRNGLLFSDGSSLTSADVAWSLRRLLDPQTKAPVAEEFLVPGGVTIETPDKLTVTIHLPKRVIGVERIFDEIAIEPANRPSEGRVTAGPFTVDEYKRGQYLRLKRNPHYWRRDGANVQLPYASGVRLDILNNREQEMALFLRGEYDLIDGPSPDYFGLLAQKSPQSARDLGASLNTEQLWFNQASQAALPDYEKAWFQNRGFRVAVSQAIHRADLARIAYDGHATPAYGFISPANKMWHNDSLKVPQESVAEANRLLASSGFHRSGNQLWDSAGHPVKFSIVTNAGNLARQKMAALIQQDLAALGMQVTLVSLDFPALIERLMHKQDYEACLLGLSNAEADPSTMMNLWLSSSPNHQWNPSQKTPATEWEAEIDKEMQLQASTPLYKDRKRALDRVQQIVADQQPFIYLLYPNALQAISLQLRGVQPAILSPGPFWNIDALLREGGGR
jgi:peptide/nickel transport system substrate-binding protein